MGLGLSSAPAVSSPGLFINDDCKHGAGGNLLSSVWRLLSARKLLALRSFPNTKQKGYRQEEA